MLKLGAKRQGKPAYQKTTKNKIFGGRVDWEQVPKV